MIFTRIWIYCRLSYYRQTTGKKIHNNREYFRLHNRPIGVFLFWHGYEITSEKYTAHTINAIYQLGCESLLNGKIDIRIGSKFVCWIIITQLIQYSRCDVNYKIDYLMGYVVHCQLKGNPLFYQRQAHRHRAWTLYYLDLVFLVFGWTSTDGIENLWLIIHGFEACYSKYWCFGWHWTGSD